MSNATGWLVQTLMSLICPTTLQLQAGSLQTWLPQHVIDLSPVGCFRSMDWFKGTTVQIPRISFFSSIFPGSKFEIHSCAQTVVLLYRQAKKATSSPVIAPGIAQELRAALLRKGAPWHCGRGVESWSRWPGDLVGRCWDQWFNKAIFVDIVLNSVLLPSYVRDPRYLAPSRVGSLVGRLGARDCAHKLLVKPTLEWHLVAAYVTYIQAEWWQWQVNTYPHYASLCAHTHRLVYIYIYIKYI